MSDYLKSVDELVIEYETNFARFERFCVSLVSAIEGGLPIVATSVVWDRGRDGRGVGQASGMFVCTSLRDSVDAKAYEDIERLTQTTRDIRALYFCSSQSITEHQCDKIEAALREYLPETCRVIVLGAIQLAELGRSRGDALERIYGGEIRDVLDRIAPLASGEEELRGLRLALLSSGSDESVEIRSSVYKNAVLDVLSDGMARTIERISLDVSGALKLGRSIPSLSLEPYIHQLEVDGMVGRQGGTIFGITEVGKDHLDNVRASGAASLLEGRAEIRKAFEDAVGDRIEDSEFQRIWQVFEDRLAFYLQSRGEQIVAEVTDIFAVVEGDELASNVADDVRPLSFLDDLANAVAANARFPDRQEAIAQAVRDLFSDRTGSGGKWLVGVCAAFVAACTMGLEPASAEVVRSIMRRLTLVLDTDVVLSLLGEGESEHDAVLAIVSKWRENRGKVLVATPVLQEVAYHASIAEHDFQQVKLQLPGDEVYRAQFIENAFVRSFARQLSANSSLRLSHWRDFMSQFRGGNEYDFGPVFEFLASEYKLERLPDRDTSQSQQVDAVRTYIIDLVEERKFRVEKNERDKARRDAELYVALAAHVARLRESDPDSGCLLISSARRLSAVDKKFCMTGERRLVISISSALFLVSTLPSVSLGLSAMKSFLFDERRSRFSSELERTALRMVSASKEHAAFVFSRRGLLVRELKNRLVSRAERVGGELNRSEMAEVEKAALRPENRESLIAALAESLDKVGANARTDARLKDALRDLEATKRALELERGRNKKK